MLVGLLVWLWVNYSVGVIVRSRLKGKLFKQLIEIDETYRYRFGCRWHCWWGLNKDFSRSENNVSKIE